MDGMASAGCQGQQRGRTMEIAENPSVTYGDAHLWCDRNGVLRMATDVSDLMLPIAHPTWLRLSPAATGLAPQSPDEAGWVLPGAPEAREDADAAMVAIRVSSLLPDLLLAGA